MSRVGGDVETQHKQITSIRFDDEAAWTPHVAQSATRSIAAPNAHQNRIAEETRLKGLLSWRCGAERPCAAGHVGTF
jgi:hypothetical protein